MYFYLSIVQSILPLVNGKVSTEGQLDNAPQKG